MFKRAFLAGVLALVLVGCGTAGSAAAPPASSTTALNHVHSIAIMPGNPGNLFLGAHFRLYHSVDGGVHWKSLFSQMMLSMAYDPLHPNTFWGISLQGGPLKSTDSGARWSSMRGLVKGQVTGVAYDRGTHTVLAWGNGAFASTDGGAHWSAIAPLKGQAVAGIAAGPDGTEYAATGNGLFVSARPGRGSARSWHSVSAVAGQPMSQVVAAARTAYAVSPLYLLRSTNDGRTWTPLTKAPTGTEFIGVAPSDPNEVFAEVANQGFMVTHNGGASWQSSNSGIHDRDFSASTIQVAPSNPRVAYTGAWGLHFYATRDGGRQWKEVASLTK